MFEKIQLGFVKWLNSVLSYIISWLGLKVFYEAYIHEDRNGKVQALMFTNDPRHIMFMKNEVVPLSKLIEELQDSILMLEEKVIEAGGIIEYEKPSKGQEE